MDTIEKILSNLFVFQIITDLFKVTIGAGLCFGALKWRKGLLSSTAIGWGAFLGAVVSALIADYFGAAGVIVCLLAGIVGLPILTYTVFGVNRFMLGFLVGCKLSFMVTTCLAKDGKMEILTALMLPLVAGTIIGIILMAWTQIRVSAFVLACSFVGASEAAPVISEWINRAGYALTGDPSWLLDPLDLIFALFKIELTDSWTLIALLVLMVVGIYTQISNMKKKNIPLDTPLIAYETTSGPNGRIYNQDGSFVDTL